MGTAYKCDGVPPSSRPVQLHAAAAAPTAGSRQLQRAFAVPARRAHRPSGELLAHALLTTTAGAAIEPWRATAHQQHRSVKPTIAAERAARRPTANAGVADSMCGGVCGRRQPACAA